MNRHGVKQLLAHTVCKPAEVCEHANRCEPADDLHRRGASLTNALPFGETEAVLYSLVRMMAQRDSHTAGHCERVALSGVALGVALRLDSASLQALYVGGYVHDIGKVGVPDSVLFKPGKLNAEEWEIMRSHPCLR